MDTPLKRTVLETLKEQEEAGVSTKNPANCDDEISIAQIPPSPFLRTLGHGTGVHVMFIKRNHLPGGGRSPWAIKLLNGRGDGLVNKRLAEEAKILRQLNHPSIIGYRAFDTLEQGRHFIAMEYCKTSLGSLLEKRYERKQGPMDANVIMRMVVHVLRGLEYLHTVAHILHGDMKSFNVLVNDDCKVFKICDFGVSLDLNKEGYVDLERNPDAQYVGTGIWSAPEVLENDPELVSVKADIFSFGLVIYETIALMPPHTFTGIKDESIVNSVGYASLKAKVNVLPTNRQLDFADVIEVEDDDEDEVAENSDEQSKRKIDERRSDELSKKMKLEEFVHLSSSSEEYAEDVCISTANDNLTSIIGSAPVNASVTENSASTRPVSDAAFVPCSSTTAASTTAASTTAASTTAPVDDISERSGKRLLPQGPHDIITITDSSSEEFGSHQHEDEEDDQWYGEDGESYHSNEEPYNEDEEVFEDEVYEEEISEGVDENMYDDVDEHMHDDVDENIYDGDENIYEGVEDDVYEGDEEEDDGPYLNYGVLGTRPLIPTNIELNESYNPLLEIFFLCTNAEPEDRPTARELLDALEDTIAYDIPSVNKSEMDKNKGIVANEGSEQVISIVTNEVDKLSPGNVKEKDLVATQGEPATEKSEEAVSAPRSEVESPIVEKPEQATSGCADQVYDQPTKPKEKGENGGTITGDPAPGIDKNPTDNGDERATNIAAPTSE